jgi:hypothetical protein
MRPVIRRTLVVAIACLLPLLVLAAPAFAQAGPPSPRVRPLSSGMPDFVREAADRSPSIRALLARLEGSDVVVYVRMLPFASTAIDGHIALQSVASGTRYLVVELAGGRSRLVQMATLGHELHHALEVAAEPSIVSANTLATYYARIGMQVEGNSGHLTFETRAAGDAGRLARRELLSPISSRSTEWTSK